MPAKIVEDGLPALTLKLRRILGLGVERLFHEDAAGALDEL